MTETYTTGVSAAIPVRKRFSWGGIIAGLFTALSTMVVLTVLGVAIGLTAADAQSNPRNFGMGAGIWGAISALISFFAGGWMAAWARPSRHEGNGALQGALTWMVALVLMVYALAGGAGALLQTAGSAAATGVQAASTAAGAMAGDEQMRQEAQATAEDATDDLQAAAQDVRQQVTPQRVEEATGAAAGGAWGTLVTLLLTLGASVAGGYVGAKSDDHDTVRRV